MTATPTTAVASPAPPKKRLHHRSYRWLIWLVAFTAVAVGAWRYLRARGDAPVSVQTIGVQRGSVRDFVSSVAAGRVAAKQEATVRAEIAGTVSVIHRRRGDTVRVGEPLFEYGAVDLTERVRLASTAVVMAQAQVKQAEQNAAVTETNLARARRLLESKSIASAEVETLEGQSLVMQRTIEAARAAVKQAQANVEIARTAAGKSVVRAPFSGTVLDVKIEVGEATTPGTPVVLLADASALHVDAEVDEADLARIKEGMPTDVTFDALPGERIRGKVTTIAPSVARDARGGRSIAVDVELPLDPRLRVGMSADVDIIVAVHEGSLWVPPNAVIGRGAERAVYVVQGGLAKKRSIDVGISTWEAVEIKSGVTEADMVVVTLSAAKLGDGVKVQVVPGAPK